MSDTDDQIIGQMLSRREALAFLGIVSAAMLASCAPGVSPATEAASQPAQSSAGASPTTGQVMTEAVSTSAPQATTAGVSLPTCVVRPAMTEGPYFIDTGLNRSDVRSDPSDNAVSAGIPLNLIFRVSQLDAASCSVLSGAVVDIWHCDAEGRYSGVEQQGGKQFLRGYQVTGADGLATFTTIYPGWYPGRATHIHFKIRSDPSQSPGWDFTSQLFFPEEINDVVFGLAPYNSRDKGGRTVNTRDGIFQSGGDQTLLAVSPEGEGYSGTFDIGLQLG